MRCRIAAGAYEEAERLYELLGLLWPDSRTTARLGRGVCLQLRGELAEAERAYDDVLQAEPQNAYALADRAEVRLLTGRKDAARADLTVLERSKSALRRAPTARREASRVLAREGL